MYTYNGDFTFSGMVDGNAFTVFSSFYPNFPATSAPAVNVGTPDFVCGDTNGDGVLNGNDATIFSSVFGNGDQTFNQGFGPGNGLPRL